MCKLNICATIFNIGSMLPQQAWLILTGKRLICVILITNAE